jgi:hypothetical protein
LADGESTDRHKLSLPLSRLIHLVDIHAIYLRVLQTLSLLHSQIHLFIMFLTFFLGPGSNMRCDLCPIAQTVDDESGDEQKLLVGAPIG